MRHREREKERERQLTVAENYYKKQHKAWWKYRKNNKYEIARKGESERENENTKGGGERKKLLCVK